MPRKKTVDLKKLLEAVESGRNSKDIMNEFGIKTSAQLKALVYDALVDQDKAKEIVSTRGAAGRKSKEIVVNKRGSLVIPKDLVEDMGFNIEEMFSVRKTKSGISLRKL